MKLSARSVGGSVLSTYHPRKRTLSPAGVSNRSESKTSLLGTEVDIVFSMHFPLANLKMSSFNSGDRHCFVVDPCDGGTCGLDVR